MTDPLGTPWTRRHTGGPRGWAAAMTGVSAWLGWMLVVIVAGSGLPWQTLVWWSAVAAFAASIVVTPLAYAGLKRCYDAPQTRNVTVEDVPRRRPDSNRIGGRRMMQTGPRTIKIVDDLPEGVSTSLMEDWIRDVWREEASWNVPSGRERNLSDETVKRVKAWLADRGLIELYGTDHWRWLERGERLCEHLERGYDLGVLLDNPPTLEDA